MSEHNHGQLVPDTGGAAEGQSLIDSFVGVMIAVIVGAGVSIPVIQDVLNNVGINGTAATVLSFTPLGISVSVFLSSVAPIRG